MVQQVIIQSLSIISWVYSTSFVSFRVVSLSFCVVHTSICHLVISEVLLFFVSRNTSLLS